MYSSHIADASMRTVPSISLVWFLMGTTDQGLDDKAPQPGLERKPEIKIAFEPRSRNCRSKALGCLINNNNKMMKYIYSG